MRPELGTVLESGTTVGAWVNDLIEKCLEVEDFCRQVSA